jgi:DnaJ-class molecular chaperone
MRLYCCVVKDADEQPGLETGDVIVILTQTKEEPEEKEVNGTDKKAKIEGEKAEIKRPAFKRLKNTVDLIIDVKISLIESLLGFKLAIKHLDDRVVIIESPPNYVAKHEDIVVVENEGMPLENNPNQHGDLYVKLTVEMPTAQQLQTVASKLKELLPKPLHVVEPGLENEEIAHWDPARAAEGETLHTATHVAKQYDEREHKEKQERRAEEKAARSEAYEEDEEGAGGQAGCRQM